MTESQIREKIKMPLFDYDATNPGFVSFRVLRTWIGKVKKAIPAARYITDGYFIIKNREG